MGFCEPREAHAARARIGRTQSSMGNAIKDLNVSALNCLVELQKSTADVCALRKREKAGAKTPHGCFAFDTSELSGPQIRPLRSRTYLATRGADDDDDGDVMLSPSLS